MLSLSAQIGIGICVGCTLCVICCCGTKQYAKYLKNSYHKGKKTIWFRGFNKYEKPKEEQSKPFNQLLERGDIIVRDFRSQSSKNNGKDIKQQPQPQSVRIVSLNMEMGKQINKIISALKTLNADIIFLQEVDVSTRRLNYVDMVSELAMELNMNSIFTVEVIVDTETNLLYEATGYEGNAILSKYDFIATEGIVVKCARYKRYLHKKKLHTEAMAIMEVPTLGRIACVSAHLDPHWCGVNGRIRQFHEILKYVSDYKHSFDHLIICGDLNTVCHGLNRLYPSIGCDNESRFGHLGKTEAEYFNDNGVETGNDEFKLDLYDPFHKVNDYTMYALGGGYKSKADWCLLDCDLKVLDKKVCPVKERCSDHQWIMVDIALK